MRYPSALWLGDGISGGSFTGAPWRVLLHTTETRGIPKYSDGKSAPHLTYAPLSRRWYQHTSLADAARALRNEPGGVQTNRANCIQVEIICYSARRLSESVTPRGLWVGDLPDTAIEDLRKFIAWCGREFGVKPVWPNKQALNSGEANAPGFRMTFAEWNLFNGVAGHQHAPENIHWDPAALDWGRLMATTPTTGEDEMVLKRGDSGNAVSRYQQGLVNNGFKIAADGVFGPDTEAAVKTYQKYADLPQTGQIDGVTGALLLEWVADRVGTPAQLTAEQIQIIQDGAVVAVGKKLVG